MDRKLDSSTLATKELDDLMVALRQRRIPLKYTYMDAVGADGHYKLVRSNDYGLTNEETKLLQGSLTSVIQPKLGGQRVTVVDIGPGNGEKAIQVIRQLQQTMPDITYVGVDISERLLFTTKNVISKALPNIPVTTQRLDFEKDALKPADKMTSVWLLLGQTLGNPFDRERTLLNIRRGMGSEDMLVVGVELYRQDKVPEVLSHYQNETFIPLVMAYVKFLGFQREDGVVKIIFNPVTKDVEARFSLACDISLQIKDDDVIDFQRDEELLVFISHRFEIGKLHDLFARVGCQIVATRYNETSSYALLFAEPKYRQSVRSNASRS